MQQFLVDYQVNIINNKSISSQQQQLKVHTMSFSLSSRMQGGLALVNQTPVALSLALLLLAAARAGHRSSAVRHLTSESHF
jgi:hypothetical protein